MNEEKIYNDEEFNRQDERAQESIKKLDDFFNSTNDETNKREYDYLNDIEEQDVKIEDLKNLINQLEAMQAEEVPNENIQEQSQSNEKGRAYTKSIPGVKNSKPLEDNTAKEIAQSFINCFVLCMVTALMGTGWLLYIINHI